LIIFSCLIASCASTNVFREINLTKSSTLYIPEQEIVSRVALGNTLLSKAIETKGPALALSGSAIFGTNNIFKPTFHVFAQMDQEKFITDRHSIKGLQCASFNFQAWSTRKFGMGSAAYPGRSQILPICKEPNGFFSLYSLEGDKLYEVNRNLIKETIKRDVNSLTFKQELIYNGRVDNDVRIIYREFSGDMARPAFTQSLQYDLNSSKVISFKSVSIEIIEANNNFMTYRVISHF